MKNISRKPVRIRKIDEKVYREFKIACSMTEYKIWEVVESLMQDYSNKVWSLQVIRDKAIERGVLVNED